MTYARKTLSEIKLIHGNYGNFIKGQKLQKDKEKKYKTPPYQDLAASTEVEGETLNEKCWPGYEKKGMKTMFGKRYPNCVKKKKTKKEEFSDWRSELEQIEEKKMTKAQIKKRDEIADAISTKDMKDRYGDKNVKYAIATKLAMKEGLDDDDIKRALTERYSDFILYDPKFNKNTYFLWLAPFIVLLIGFWWVYSMSTKNYISQSKDRDLEK